MRCACSGGTSSAARSYAAWLCGDSRPGASSAALSPEQAPAASMPCTSTISAAVLALLLTPLAGADPGTPDAPQLPGRPALAAGAATPPDEPAGAPPALLAAGTRPAWQNTKGPSAPWVDGGTTGEGHQKRPSLQPLILHILACTDNAIPYAYLQRTR